VDLSQENWTKQLTEDNNSVTLDVRTEDEFNEAHIPNATNINIYMGQGFIDEVEKLDKSRNYYVYCKSGARSAQACAIMNQLGYENAFNLLGGFNNWEGEVSN